MDIKEKALTLVLDLVTVNNMKGVVETLKKEIMRSQADTFEDGAIYRSKLVRGIHQVLLLCDLSV